MFADEKSGPRQVPLARLKPIGERLQHVRRIIRADTEIGPRRHLHLAHEQVGVVAPRHHAAGAGDAQRLRPPRLDGSAELVRKHLRMIGRRAHLRPARVHLHLDGGEQIAGIAQDAALVAPGRQRYRRQWWPLPAVRVDLAPEASLRVAQQHLAHDAMRALAVGQRQLQPRWRMAISSAFQLILSIQHFPIILMVLADEPGGWAW